MSTDHPGEHVHRLMHDAAQAAGLVVLLGVRPNGRGWFAHCDGEEVDGGTPEQAVQDLIVAVQRREAEKARRGLMAGYDATERAEGLARLTAAPSGRTTTEEND